MITIDRGDLERAFSLNGWLDTQTGEVIFLFPYKESDGVMRFELKPEMQKHPERYIRVPYVGSSRLSTMYIDSLHLDESILRKYEIDPTPLRGSPMMLEAPYREHKKRTPEEVAYSNRMHRLEEDLDLDSCEFTSAIIIEQIEIWCKAKGYALSGSWLDF